MVRRHWGATPLVIDPTRTYEHRSLKPGGLWYEVDGAWEEWCRDNDFGLDRYKVATEVEVDLSRLLVIETEAQIEAFNRRFGVQRYTFLREIAWAEVATRYAGIEVPDFWALGEYRFHHGYLWYYAWDASSGCIWDLSAIKVKHEPYQRGIRIREEIEK